MQRWMLWLWPLVGFALYMLQFRAMFSSALRAFTGT